MDPLVYKVLPVTKATLVPLVLQELQAPLVSKVIPEQLVPEVMTDKLARKVRLELQVP
jgi:hypothetical protein